MRQFMNHCVRYVSVVTIMDGLSFGVNCSISVRVVRVMSSRKWTSPIDDSNVPNSMTFLMDGTRSAAVAVFAGKGKKSRNNMTFITNAAPTITSRAGTRDNTYPPNKQNAATEYNVCPGAATWMSA